MTEEVGKLIRKAEHALEVAEDLMQDGYKPFNRSAVQR